VFISDHQGRFGVKDLDPTAGEERISRGGVDHGCQVWQIGHYSK
jgi:hypothetical protein